MMFSAVSAKAETLVIDSTTERIISSLLRKEFCLMKRVHQIVCLAVVGLLSLVGTATAAGLIVDTSQSVMSVDISLGGYFLTDPTDPGASIELPGTPGALYYPLTFADGQGDFADGTLPLGDGTRVPGFSNGLSAQVGGSLQADVGGGTLGGGSSLNLLDSGSWQPGNGVPGAPSPANLGIFFDPTDPANSLLPVTIVAALSNAVFDITSANFLSDPNAVLTLSTAQLTGNVAEFGLAFDIPVGPISSVMPLNGTLVGDQLTLPIDTIVEISLEGSLPIPLVVAIEITGQVVAIPEPGSIALMGMAGVGLCVVALRGRHVGRHRAPKKESSTM